MSERKQKELKLLNETITDVIYAENDKGLESGFEVLCSATEYLGDKIAEALYASGYRKITTCEHCAHRDLIYPIKEANKQAKVAYLCKVRQVMVDLDDFCALMEPKHEPNGESAEGAECPTCHGTGRIGTSDWLTKNISKARLAREKEEAIAEFHACIKNEGAKEAILKIDEMLCHHANGDIDAKELYRLFGDFKKKIVEEK